MFWGLILKANKKYTQTVVKAFHLSQAALDLSKAGDGDVQVMLTSEENTYLLCTLGKKAPQVSLDLNFDEGDQISLSTKGEGIVHLTGYLVPSEADFMDSDEDAEEEEVEAEQEQEEVLVQKGKGGKERVAKKVAEKVIKHEVVVKQGADDEDEDEMDETFELPKGAQKKKKKGGDEEEDSDEDDDESDDDDSDDSEDDEELDDSKASDGKAGQEDSDDDDEDDDDEDDSDEDDSEEEQPAAKVAKLEKKPSKLNGVEQNGKASSKELKKDDKQKEGQPKTRTLQGGLTVEDIAVGSGAEAKPGKKVAVYYEGRLKKNNKVFDSTTKGAGFKFALGRGEVIKGWDLGVAGMKVGGKRRLTVPHQLAYGTRGSPPVIPPNSTLVFDVELRNVF